MTRKYFIPTCRRPCSNPLLARPGRRPPCKNPQTGSVTPTRAQDTSRTPPHPPHAPPSDRLSRAHSCEGRDTHAPRLPIPRRASHRLSCAHSRPGTVARDTGRQPPAQWRTTVYLRAPAHRQGRHGSTGASSTTTRTVRAHAARRARRRLRQRRRRRAPSGPMRLDGRVMDDNAHRQGPRGSTGASSSVTAATTTRTVRADAARRARHGRRRAPSGPTRLAGRLVLCSNGDDDALRQGPRGSTGASSSVTAASKTRTVRADAARRARHGRRRAPSGPTRLDGRVVVGGSGDDHAHRQGRRGSTGASSSVAAATTTRTVRAVAARRARHG